MPQLEEIMSKDATETISGHVILFLESKLQWIMPVDEPPKSKRELPVECIQPVGDPLKIHCMYQIYHV